MRLSGADTQAAKYKNAKIGLTKVCDDILNDMYDY